MPITLVLSGVMTGNLPLAWLLSACAEAHLLTVRHQLVGGVPYSLSRFLGSHHENSAMRTGLCRAVGLCQCPGATSSRTVGQRCGGQTRE